jgi:DNA (cytosine-5)-methyltransferase 1
MLTFGSLFAGIGGLDLGLERAGMTCRFQVEIDDYATQVLAKHWLHVVRHRDVRSVGRHNLEYVDLICGGFPCQDISNAGKRAGIDGERSGLWAEFARIVGELRPRFVLVENVSALLGRGIGRVLGDLAALGYDAEWDVLSACQFGAPHARERLFILAYAEGLRGELWPAPSQRPGRFASGGVASDGQCWPPEPGIRRVVDGPPAGLDVLGGLDAEQGNSTQAESTQHITFQCFVREVWEHYERATASREVRSNGNSAIVSDVSYTDPRSKRLLGTWLEKDEELRDLWHAVYTEPQQATQDMQRRLFERVRTIERREKMATKNRVDRLRTLGNAVVPQVAEYIGRQIIARAGKDTANAVGSPLDLAYCV